jgi:hypothetical protein
MNKVIHFIKKFTSLIKVLTALVKEVGSLFKALLVTFVSGFALYAAVSPVIGQLLKLIWA